MNKYLWKVLITPQLWMRNYSTDKKWDEQLNKLLDTYKLEKITEFTVFLGDYEVWIKNWGYQYGNLWCKNGDIFQKSNRQPTRGTAIRLKEAVDRTLAAIREAVVLEVVLEAFEETFEQKNVSAIRKALEKTFEEKND